MVHMKISTLLTLCFIQSSVPSCSNLENTMELQLFCYKPDITFLALLTYVLSYSLTFLALLTYVLSYSLTFLALLTYVLSYSLHPYSHLICINNLMSKCKIC